MVSWTSVSTVVKMITAFVSVKVIALIIGPEGIALTGQLTNFASIVMSLSSFGINNGITKYISEYKDDPQKFVLYLGSAFRITIVASLVVGAALMLGSSFLAEKILFSPDYQYVFVFFGCSITLFALNNYLLSVVNGLRLYRKFVVISIANSFVALGFTLFLVHNFQLEGALLALVTSQSVMFCISLWLLRKEVWIKVNNFKHFSVSALKDYGHFAIMGLTIAVTAPLSQLIIRGGVIEQLSISSAGYWEGLNRLSALYLGVITPALTVYLLPRFSELHEREDIRREILNAFKNILPALTVILLAAYFLRYRIIEIVFTEEFYAMEKIFAYQLVGDLFKVAAWIVSLNMLAKRMTKVFVFTEFFFAIFYLSLAFTFMSFSGVVGVTMAYMINCMVYFIYIMVLFRKTIFSFFKYV